MDKKDNKRKKSKKYLKFAKTITPIFISVVSLIISIISVIITIKENRKNELILKPRFSLEKDTNKDENNSFIWKIKNLGGAINNATIYPIMHVTFTFYNRERKKDIKITVEISDYFSNDNKYSNSDSSFYVNDDKLDKLESFIKEYKDKILSEGFLCTGHFITPYFMLHYDDYEGNLCNETFKIDYDTFEDSLGYSLINDNIKRLEKISKMPRIDIDASMRFYEHSIISVKYKNALSQKLLNSEQEHNDYLLSVFLDLIDSKKKSVRKMLGDVILSKGTLWRRNPNTGKLFMIMDNVKEYGFTKEYNLTWLTKNGELYMME